MELVGFCKVEEVVDKQTFDSFNRYSLHRFFDKLKEEQYQHSFGRIKRKVFGSYLLFTFTDGSEESTLNVSLWREIISSLLESVV